MIKVSVLYPNGPDKKFDQDYYMNKHIPMVLQRLEGTGLVRAEVEKGIGTVEPGAPPPFVLIAHLVYNTVEEFQRAFEPHAAERIGCSAATDPRASRPSRLRAPECHRRSRSRSMMRSAAARWPPPVPTPRGVDCLEGNHQPFQERAMRFCAETRQHYSGIELHAKTM